MDHIPETLVECERSYVPKIDKYISCEEFGNTDGMSGGCQWCSEMTPYQWYMCQDYDRLHRILRDWNVTEDEAAMLIDRNKKELHEHYQRDRK